MLRRPFCGMACGFLLGILAAYAGAGDSNVYTGTENSAMQEGAGNLIVHMTPEKAVVCMACIVGMVLFGYAMLFAQSRLFLNEEKSDSEKRKTLVQILKSLFLKEFHGTEIGKNRTEHGVVQKKWLSGVRKYKTADRSRQFELKPHEKTLYLQKSPGKELGRSEMMQIIIRIVFICVCFFLGYGRYNMQQAKQQQFLSVVTDGMPVLLQGKLEKKEVKESQYTYQLTSCVVGCYQDNQLSKKTVDCGRILVYSDSDCGSIGETLIFYGKVNLWEQARNEGNFDAKDFYAARGISFYLTGAELKAVYGKASGWREAVWKLRLRVKEIYIRVLDEHKGGILAAIVVGDKEFLDAETKRLYQAGGLSHAIAISGLHLSIIGMSVYRFLRKIYFHFWEAGAIAGILVFVYGTMVGMGISVQRASGMFFVMLLGEVLGRGYDTLNALGMLALVLLWQNTNVLFDAGFQFSFLAVLGVVWVGHIGQEERQKWGKLQSTLFTGIAIQLTVLPISAWYYYEIPLYAVLINMIALPAMGVLIVCGIIGGLAGLSNLALANIVLMPCRWILGFQEWLCSVCGKLPNAMLITGQPKWWKMVIYYVGLAAVTVYCHSLRKKK